MPADVRSAELLTTSLGIGEDIDDDVAVVVSTSGTTGVPKGAMLTAPALIASASATHDRLGGPGSWLLALPAYHVAGLQVLVRSLLAGTVPVAIDPSFDVDELPSAVDGVGFRPEVRVAGRGPTGQGARRSGGRPPRSPNSTPS